MRGPKALFETEDQWVTRMGAWFSGERVVFRGQDLHADLKDMNWMELYVYGITGRRFEADQLKVLNAIWTSTSYPDPRLWNNRVTALAGTARSTPTLALSGAMAISEATIYGHRANVHAIDFIIRTKKAVEKGIKLEELVKKELKDRRTIGGYGRPLHRSDERIPHMMKLLREVGMDQGSHVQLAMQIEKQLMLGRLRMRMNISGLDAALGADLGFSVREYHIFVTPAFLAGMPPCFLDTYERAEAAFFPMRCSRIQYEGVSRREWK